MTDEQVVERLGIMRDMVRAFPQDPATDAMQLEALDAAIERFQPVSDEELREAVGYVSAFEGLASQWVAENPDAAPEVGWDKLSAAIRTVLRAVQQERSCPPALGMLAVRQDLVPDAESTSGYHVENVVVGVEQPEPPADPELAEECRSRPTEGLLVSLREWERTVERGTKAIAAIRQVLRER